MRFTQDNLDTLYNAEVVDVNGDKVGGVGQVYLDDNTGEPSWVTVKAGFFGTNETLVPLAGANVEGDRIQVPYEKSFIKDAPNLDAESHLDDDQQEELYRYYNDGGRRGDADYVGDGRMTADRDVDVDRDRNVDPAVGVDRGVGDDMREHDVRDRDAETGDRMTLHEERVDVGTERVQTGRVRLRKHVVTDTETVQVPVEREEYEIVREPVADGRVADDARLGEDEIAVDTYEERPVVRKETVATEEVGVDRRTVRDERDVSTDVSREEVEVVEDDVELDADGNPIRRDADGNPLDGRH